MANVPFSSVKTNIANLKTLKFFNYKEIILYSKTSIRFCIFLCNICSFLVLDIYSSYYIIFIFYPFLMYHKDPISSIYFIILGNFYIVTFAW